MRMHAKAQVKTEKPLFNCNKICFSITTNYRPIVGNATIILEVHPAQAKRSKRFADWVRLLPDSYSLRRQLCMVETYLINAKV